MATSENDCASMNTRIPSHATSFGSCDIPLCESENMKTNPTRKPKTVLRPKDRDKMKTSVLIQKASLAFALLGLSVVVPAWAATINVNLGDSIQGAVDAAASGDTIHIAAGVYEE